MATVHEDEIGSQRLRKPVLPELEVVAGQCANGAKTFETREELCLMSTTLGSSGVMISNSEYAR